MRFIMAAMENLHQLVVRELTALGRSRWQSVADATGVPVHTIIKIGTGVTEDPRYGTLRPLAEYFATPKKRAKPL